MNSSKMNMKIQKYLYLLVAFVLPGLVMTGIEYGAGQVGYELRSFAQEIKGIYLWLVMPLGILYTVGALVKVKLDEWKEDPGIYHLVRRILTVLLTIAILGISFCRGIFYAFTEEMVEEERLPDGYLKGTWSGFLSESQTGYYETEAGIFRRPFPGWSREQLIDVVKEEYGPEAEYVEQQPGGWHVFRMPDQVAQGKYIYFHMSDSYEKRNNGDYQILVSASGHFWQNRNRWVRLGTGGEVPFEEARDIGEELPRGLPQGESFYIACYDTEDDIGACAADLTDWLQFLKTAVMYSGGKGEIADRLPRFIYVGRGEDYFLFSMEAQEYLADESTWEERYNRMKQKLSEAIQDHRENLEAYRELLEEQEAAEGEEGSEPEEGRLEDSSLEDGAGDTQEWSFMDTYDGSFEKECQVGDGQVRYRMVVEDAALGSRFYGLLKSTDGGESWQMFNPDSFDQQMGQGIDFTFLDEKVGFATLMHNGGDEAELYVTKDGGESYQSVVMESYTVSLEDGYTYNPYDYPQMPYVEEDFYEEGSVIYVLCGQGADGDYDGGDNAGLALYRSTDGGYTFSFVEIKKPGEKE